MERGNGSAGGPITGSLLYRLLKPNAASLGYGLFLAINAASVWGGVFPCLPLEFQTRGIIFWFFLCQSQSCPAGAAQPAADGNVQNLFTGFHPFIP